MLGHMQHITCNKTYNTHLILANADNSLGWNVSYTSFAHPASASASVGQSTSPLLLLMLIHLYHCHLSHALLDDTHSLRERSAMHSMSMTLYMTFCCGQQESCMYLVGNA